MEGITFDAPERPTVEGPLIFLAGPIQGAPLWQTEAISMIRTYSTTVHIASPRRRKLERLIKPTASFAARFTESFVGEMYIEQVDWETRYLNRAAENGCILFWLAKEENHICTRAYAQTSRFELAEWKERCRWNPNIKMVVGIEHGFSGEHYMRHRLRQDFPEMPIFDDLWKTCQAAIQLARK